MKRLKLFENFNKLKKMKKYVYAYDVDDKTYYWYVDD